MKTPLIHRYFLTWSCGLKNVLLISLSSLLGKNKTLNFSVYPGRECTSLFPFQDGAKLYAQTACFPIYPIRGGGKETGEGRIISLGIVKNFTAPLPSDLPFFFFPLLHLSASYPTGLFCCFAAHVRDVVQYPKRQFVCLFC